VIESLSGRGKRNQSNEKNCVVISPEQKRAYGNEAKSSAVLNRLKDAYIQGGFVDDGGQVTYQIKNQSNRRQYK